MRLARSADAGAHSLRRKRRRQAAQHRGEAAQRGRKQQHARIDAQGRARYPVDCVFSDTGAAAISDDSTLVAHTAMRESGQPAERRDDRAFGQHLPRDASAAGADREPHGQLALTRRTIAPSAGSPRSRTPRSAARPHPPSAISSDCLNDAALRRDAAGQSSRSSSMAASCGVAASLTLIPRRHSSTSACRSTGSIGRRGLRDRHTRSQARDHAHGEPARRLAEFQA